MSKITPMKNGIGLLLRQFMNQRSLPEDYMGAPDTHKWMWKHYYDRKQIISQLKRLYS
jgi:hypothetical protein